MTWTSNLDWNLYATQDLRVLDVYSESDDPLLRARVAQNAAAPAEMLATLSIDPDNDVRSAVAGNPNTPNDCIKRLVEDRVPEVRWHLTGHPAASESFLTDVSGSAEWVDFNIVRHPNCPPDLGKELIARLCTADDTEALSRVALDPKTTPAVLQSIVNYGDEGVNTCVASNPGLTLPILLVLLNSDSYYVQASALAHRRCPVPYLVQAAHHRILDMRLSVADHPRTPPRVLAEMAVFPYGPEAFEEHSEVYANPPARGVDILRAVALNPLTPVETLDLLAEHVSTEVAQASTKNPAWFGF